MSQAAFEFDSDEAADPTYSVSELADAINGVLRSRFDEGVWVRGEIQGWNERGPHAYFRLVEVTDTGKAVVSVQFFAPQRNKLRSLLLKNGLHLADGLKVRIHGHLDFFAGGGTLGLKMSGIDPRFTLGELALQRDDVLRRLGEAGLLERNRSLDLAVAPLRIGVVTSRDSAAWADFLHEIERSGLAFHLRLVDVRVQGATAVPEITGALRELGRHPDLDALVVIRGGGSRSELATFDAEAIAMAIATSPLPVFTGLGHEIDRSVADEVAHSALKTPTACAAALVERVAGFVARSEATWSRIQHVAELGMRRSVTDLAAAAEGVRHHVLAAVARSDDRLAGRAQRVASAANRAVQQADQRLGQSASALRRVPPRLDQEVRHLDGLAQRVRLLDPATTMARGWTITRTADGRTVRSAADLQPGDRLVTTFATGTATSRVEETSS
ncbi:MAG: exodeoxyribonuclease large subunit [Actinomycetota bacterium]|jgi:exodeoxyribonuclease VII large subunit